MARYNHFGLQKYKPILFASLNIGDEFRNDFHNKGRRRKDIMCVKTGELVYIEKISKKEHKMIYIPTDFFVSSAVEILKT